MSMCSRCGTTFHCGTVEASGEPCWCTRLPSLPSSAYVPSDDAPESSRCFCPDCLRALLASAGSESQNT